MHNRIDLKQFNIRTDLIIDEQIHKDYLETKKITDTINITKVKINKELEKELSKKIGTYITIEFQDITNHEDQISIMSAVSEELHKLLISKKIKDNDDCLILGLGNRFSTADSLGPITIDKVLVTRHLFLLNTNVKEGIREVSAISPGVMANTGIETYDIITSLVQKIKPKFLIVIDSLASSSIDRINKTIQLTDTGIHPGSGIGNNRLEISSDTIGIPVIAIGVPTVVLSSILVSDTIEYICQHISYIKNNYAENKLIVKHLDTKKHLETLQKQTLNNQERENLSGLIGTLNEQEKKELIYEVLNSIDYNMIVTPKEIDFLIDKLSYVIAGAINNCLHKTIKLGFVE